jgi:hypothetical protein
LINYLAKRGVAMMRIAAVLLALAAPVGAAALQTTTAAAAAPEQPGEDEASDPEIVVEREKPKRVCETRTDTGSIIPKRICRTPEQVAADEERARIIKDNLSRDRQTAQHVAESRGNR